MLGPAAENLDRDLVPPHFLGAAYAFVQAGRVKSLHNVTATVMDPLHCVWQNSAALHTDMRERFVATCSSSQRWGI